MTFFARPLSTLAALLLSWSVWGTPGGATAALNPPAAQSNAKTTLRLEPAIQDPVVAADLAEGLYADSVRALLADLVALPTVEGNVAAREALGSRLQRAAQAVGLTFERAVDGNAYLIGMPPARVLKPVYWVVAHGDVVPAERSAWRVPPFAVTVRGDTLYGRGTLDDKGAIAASLYAMAALRESGAFLHREPRLVVGMHEETDWSGISALLKEREVPDFAIVVDADFPVTVGERGYVDLAVTAAAPQGGSEWPKLLSFSGGTAANVVAARATLEIQAEPGRGAALERRVRESARIPGEVGADIALEIQRTGDRLQLTAIGRAAHGSTPREGRNAIDPLVRLGCDAGVFHGPQAILARGTRDHVAGKPDGSGLEIASDVECLGSTTVNLGTVSLDGGALTFVLNIRATNAWPVAEVIRRVEKTLAAAPGVTTRTLGGPGFDAFLTAPRSTLVDQLSEAYYTETDRRVAPGCIGGTTYAKAFLGTKTHALSFGPAEPALGEDAAYHADPEYILQDALRRNLRIYAQALFRLSTLAELSGEPATTGRNPAP